MTGTVMRAAGAVCAIALVGVLPQAAHAASEMELGGYHDEALRAAQQGLALPGTDLQLQVTIEDSSRSALTAFTPRFGGIGNAARRTIDLRETDRLTLPGSPDQVQLRLGDSAEIAGSEVGLAAVAEGQSEAAGEYGFRVGGQLAVDSLRFDAIYGQDGSPLTTTPGNRMTARVTYGLGPLDARISYDLVESDATGEESRQLELGSQLSLRPGVVVEGALAYGEDEQRDPTTAGLVSLRLNF